MQELLVGQQSMHCMMPQSSPEEPRNVALSAASLNSLLASSGQVWLIVMS